MNGNDLAYHVWLKKAKKHPWQQLKTSGDSPLSLEDAMQFFQDSSLIWEVDVWVHDNPDYSRITIAQSRTDTPGTMARLFREGKMTGGKS